MRYIPPELKAKIDKAYQSIYNNADPKMEVLVQKSGISLNDTEVFYAETIRQKTGLGDISVALKRTKPDKGPEMAYEIHVDNGMVKTAVKNLRNIAMSKWIDQFEVEPGRAVAIEFDGYWVTDSQRRYNLITSSKPYIFWTDNNDVLWVQLWDEAGTKIQLAADVIKIASIRGWKNTQVIAMDQGLICAYIKSDGLVYYRTYAQQADGTYLWEIERQITQFAAPVQAIGLFRTNDYRTGFMAEGNGQITWALTSRAWAGMGTQPEVITAGTASLDFTFIKISRYDMYSPDERITLSPGITATLLYTLADNRIISLENIPNEVNDYGYIIRVTLQHGLTSIDPVDFTVVDDTNFNFTVDIVTRISQYVYELHASNFNNANGNLTVSFKGSGNTKGDIGQAVNPFTGVFTPVGLVRTYTPPPQVVNIYNAE